MNIWQGLIQEHTRPSTLRHKPSLTEECILKDIRRDIPELQNVQDGVVLSIWQNFCEDHHAASLLPWVRSHLAGFLAHAQSVLPLSPEEITALLTDAPPHWVSVTLDDEGKVLSGNVLRQSSNAESSEEGGLSIIVPGPVRLGAPLTPEQQLSSVQNVESALNELRLWRTAFQTAKTKTSVLPEGTQLLELKKSSPGFCINALIHRGNTFTRTTLLANLTEEEARHEHEKLSQHLPEHPSLEWVEASLLSTGNLMAINQTSCLHIVQREADTEDGRVQITLTPQPHPFPATLKLQPNERFIRAKKTFFSEEK